MGESVMFPASLLLSKPLLIAGVATFTLSAGAALFQTARLAGVRAELAQERQDRADERALATAAAVTASESYRAEERRRVEIQQGVLRETERALALARSDSARADSAGQRLRDQLARLAAVSGGPAGDSATGGAGAAAAATRAVLADVQRRLDEATGALARFADESRIAGLACERSYDALTKGPEHVAASARDLPLPRHEGAVP